MLSERAIKLLKIAGYSAAAIAIIMGGAFMAPAALSGAQALGLGIGTNVFSTGMYGTYGLIAKAPLIGSFFAPATTNAMAMAPIIAGSIGGLMTTAGVIGSKALDRLDKLKSKVSKRQK